MKVVFENKDLLYIYENGKEKGKPTFSKEIVRGFIRKINILIEVNSTFELTQFKSLNFEQLKGSLKGFHSVRVNDQYRIILKINEESDGLSTVEIVEIRQLTDYHK